MTATYLTKGIYSAGVELLAKNWNQSRPVRLLGISLSGFAVDYETEQLSLFQLPEMSCHSDKEERLEKIRNKYGFAKISRAVLMKKLDKE